MAVQTDERPRCLLLVDLCANSPPKSSRGTARSGCNIIGAAMGLLSSGRRRRRVCKRLHTCCPMSRLGAHHWGSGRCKWMPQAQNR